MEQIKDIGVIRDSKNRPWKIGLFLCDKCGSRTEKRVSNGLRAKSCGCKNKKHYHGRSGTPLYKSWQGIVQRCTNPKNPKYKNWGGRGISVCSEWLKSSECFMEWALSNGYKDGLEIDRENNDGDYTPKNCRFVTRAQNNRNKRDNKLKYPYLSMIKGLYSSGVLSHRKLAKLFDVGHSTIRNVVNGDTWV